MQSWHCAYFSDSNIIKLNYYSANVLWHHISLQVITNVSENRFAHIFYSEDEAVYSPNIPGCWQVSLTRKEASSEACQGHARFQHQDASCHQVFFLQGKAPKEIHAILTKTSACFLLGQAKDLSAPGFSRFWRKIHDIQTGTLVCFLPGRAKDLSAPRLILFWRKFTPFWQKN